MMQVALTIEDLPGSALEAARVFYAEWLPQAHAAFEGEADNIAFVLPAAEYDHSDWRRAAAHDLARAYAPTRVNLIGGGDDTADALEQTLAYLDAAAGVTGHYLPLDGEGAGNPLG